MTQVDTRPDGSDDADENGLDILPDTISDLAQGLPITTVGLGALVVALPFVVLLGGTAAGMSPIVAGAPLVLVGLIAAVLLFHYSVELFVLGLLLLRASTDKFGGFGPLTVSSVLGLIMIAVTLVWLPLRRRLRPHPGSSMQITLVAYGAAAALSVFVSLRPQVSLIDAIKLLSAICVFLVVDRLLAAGASERRLLAVMLASAIIPMIVAGTDIAFGRALESKGEFDRLAATFGQSNGFSRYLMVMLIMGVASLPVWRRTSTKLMILAGCGAGAGALVLTYTRASWIGAACGLALVIASQKQFRLPAGLTALAIMAALLPTVGARFADLGGSEQGAAAISPSNSLEWRLGFWQEVIALAEDTPINGIGLGVTSQVSEAGKEPHSGIVGAYAETGIVGLFAFSFLLVTMLVTAYVAVRNTRGSARLITVGYLASVIALVAVATVTNAMGQTALLWYLFGFGALAIRLGRRRARDLLDSRPLATRLESPTTNWRLRQLTYERVNAPDPVKASVGAAGPQAVTSWSGRSRSFDGLDLSNAAPDNHSPGNHTSGNGD